MEINPGLNLENSTFDKCNKIVIIEINIGLNEKYISNVYMKKMQAINLNGNEKFDILTRKTLK